MLLLFHYIGKLLSALSAAIGGFFIVSSANVAGALIEISVEQVLL